MRSPYYTLPLLNPQVPPVIEIIKQPPTQAMTIDAALDQLSTNLPAHLRHYPTLFKQLYADKLWHQLTVALDSFASSPDASLHLPFLFTNFISVAPLPTVFSPFAYGKLAVKAVRQLSNGEALLLCKSLKEQCKKDTNETKAVYLMFGVECAHYELLAGNLIEAKRIMEQEARPIMEQLSGLSPIIMAFYYRVLAEVSKASGRQDDLYNNLVKYMTIVQHEGCEEERQFLNQDMAHDFILSALLSDKLYNFGELLSFEQILNQSDLLSTIIVFQHGDLNAKINLHPQLAPHEPFLTHKRKLMGLAVALDKTARAGQSEIPLTTLSSLLQSTSVAATERLLLDGMALDLFEGHIDQLANQFHLTAARPSHLDKEQIKALADGFTSYLNRLEECITRVRSDLPATVTL